jgi:hypothetical protein
MLVKEELLGVELLSQVQLEKVVEWHVVPVSSEYQDLVSKADCRVPIPRCRSSAGQESILLL